MFELLFIVLGVVYYFIASKIDYWETMCRLGYAICAPQGYLDHPFAYHLIGLVLFIASALPCIWFSVVPWWVGPPLTTVTWLCSAIRGRNTAFAAYRQILSGILDSGEPLGDRERAALQLELSKSNEALLNDARMS